MEKLKTLTSITWILAAMLAAELGFLVYQITPMSKITWLTIGIIAISCLYLVRMALGALKELKNKHKE